MRLGNPSFWKAACPCAENTGLSRIPVQNESTQFCHPHSSPQNLNTRHPQNVQNSCLRQYPHILREQRLALLSTVGQISHRTLSNSHAHTCKCTDLFPTKDLKEDDLKKHFSLKESTGHLTRLYLRWSRIRASLQTLCFSSYAEPTAQLLFLLCLVMSYDMWWLEGNLK